VRRPVAAFLFFSASALPAESIAHQRDDEKESGDGSPHSTRAGRGVASGHQTDPLARERKGMRTIQMLPAVYCLPLSEPIAPHLDGLLGRLPARPDAGKAKKAD
jgi:hypothetical protein